MMKIKKLKMSKFLAMTTLFIMVTLGDALAKCVSENRNVTDVVVKSAKTYDIWTTDIKLIPWQVEIFKITENMDRVRYGCSGSIMTRRWIVSAGRCFHTNETREVRAGTTDLLDGGSIHKILRSIVHPNIRRVSGLWINNVAVAKVKEPFVFDATRQPVPHYRPHFSPLKGSTLAIISGWGLNKDRSPNLLQSLVVPILDKYACRWVTDVAFHNGLLCAGYVEGDTSTCKGDMGGPLTVNGVLVGIGSSKIGCSLPPPRGVYTKVVHVFVWIRNNAKN